MLNNKQITDITKTKKGNNALFCGDEFLFSVDDEVLYKNNISIGSCFTRQELACIYKQSNDSKAVDRCYTYLSARMHGKKELYRKLLRHFDADSARYAVDKMEELRLVDDEQFARAKARYLFETKKESVKGVRAKLVRLGIDKDVVDSVLSNFDIQDQTRQICTLLQGRYSQRLDSPQKVVASLMRKGFAFSDIRKAFEILDIDIQEY